MARNGVEQHSLLSILGLILLAGAILWIDLEAAPWLFKALASLLLAAALWLFWRAIKRLKFSRSLDSRVAHWQASAGQGSAVLVDVKGQVLAANGDFARLAGIHPDSLQQKTIDVSLLATVPHAWAELRQRCLIGKSWHGALEIGKKRLDLTAYPVIGIEESLAPLMVLEIAEFMLSSNEDLPSLVMSRVPLGIMVLHGRRVTRVNEGFCFLLAKTRTQVENSLISDVFGVGSSFEQALSEALMPLLTNAKVTSAVSLQRSDGKSIWCELVFSCLDPNKPQAGLLVTLSDASESRKREEILRQAAVVFEAASDAILVLDAEKRIRMTNKAFTRISGYEPNDVLGKPPKLLFSSKQPAELYDHIFNQIAQENVWQGEIWSRRRDGAVYPQWATISAVRNEQNEIIEYVFMASDITERKRAEERLNYQANYDGLTQLPNRTLFVDRLGQAMARAKREGTTLALLFIDLDRFKNVNDSMGHSAGDKLLINVANTLNGCIRESDTIARFGGDEFAMILSPIYGAKNAGTVAQTVLKVLSRPFNIDGYDCIVGGSIGISVFPGDGETSEELIRNADAAMYRAKDSGRNTYEFFTAEMQQMAMARLGLERDLRFAIERQEFILHFQPQMSLATNQVVGLEVLVRWESGTRGLVSPADFIGLAEENGQILALGDWVLKRACQQYVEWFSEGIAPGYIAVNVSGRQFRSAKFTSRLREILTETKMPARGLEIELTESFLMEDQEAVMRTLNELREMGVTLSVDDFGTGYSSLSYLKRFPISTLKIDKSFVQDVPGDDEDVAIVSAIIRMAHALKLDVVAEGVETAEQQQFLHKQGCQIVQGFLFSRPLNADECSKFLRKRLEESSSSSQIA